MKLLTIDQYLKLISDNDVKQICEPLFKNFGINDFSYTRIYPDGTRFYLTASNHILEWIFKSKCSAAKPIGVSIKEGLYFVKDMTKDLSREAAAKCLQQMHGSCNYFGIDRDKGGCDIVRRPSPDYCEVFDFGSPAYNPLSPEFYINNQDVLQHFILYFKEKAKGLIELADNNRIATLDYAKRQINQQREVQSIDLAGAKAAFYSETSLQRLAVEGEFGEVYLTRREIECLLYLIRGRSAKETATILSISPKSVESYIKQVKEKLGCYKRSQLIDRAIDINLINIGYLNWLVSKK